MSELIQLENLPVETLAEMANEAAAACEASGRKTVEHAATCGRALLAIRPQIPHGEWESWVELNFSHGIRRAQQFMDVAKAHRGALLEDATSLRHALRLIAESPEKQQKKAEREARKAEAPQKSLAPATPAPPVSSGVIRHEDPPTTQAQPEKPEWLADPDELDRPEEDDLPPLPKTNTHHTTENRCVPDARETDRVGIVPPDDPKTYHDGHWYEWNEHLGRMVVVTDDQILWRGKAIGEARGLALTVSDIVTQSLAAAPVAKSENTTSPVVESTKEFVSSKPGKVPTVTQLRSMVEDRADIGTHRHLWSEAMVKAVQEWASYKQSLTGKAKIRSLEQWSVALSRIENVVMVQGWPAVADMIEKAIANGWQGWEHETAGGNRKPAPVAPHRTFTRLSQAEVKYDELPE